MTNEHRLWLLLRQLTTVNTFMNTGAHPDDEMDVLLAYLAQGQGVRSVVVCATRGEGGQNAIGPEQDAALGAVRSRELAAVAREIGFAVYHLGEELDDPIRDFGFSRTAADTLRRWGHQRALERLVRLVRQTRPDVLFTSFPDVPGQHGHHRAVTALTLEAYEAAADPNAFPEHLAEGLRPWAVPKLYLPAQFLGATVYEPYHLDPTLSLPVGEVDPVLGRSYVELGTEALSHHRTQGLERYIQDRLQQERARREGGIPAIGEESEEVPLFHLHLARSRVPVLDREDSPFAGLPRRVADLAARADQLGERDPARATAVREGLFTIQQAIDRAVAAFPRGEQVAPELHQALAAVRRVRGLLGQWLRPITESAGATGEDAATEAAYDLDYRLAVKEEQIQAASAAALGVSASLSAPRWQAVPGEAVPITVIARVEGFRPVAGLQVELSAPPDWSITRLAAKPPKGDAALEPPALTDNSGGGTAAAAHFLLQVPHRAPYVHPYHPLQVAGQVSYQADGVRVSVPVAPPEPLAVLPPVGLRVSPQRLLVRCDEAAGSAAERTLTVHVEAVRNSPGDAGRIWLQAPAGWGIHPQAAVLPPGLAGARQQFSFQVVPPGAPAPGRYPLEFRLEVGQPPVPGACGEESAHAQLACGVERIAYSHLETIHLVSPARAEVLALPLRLPRGLRVGYVDSGFDPVPAFLEQMGAKVHLLDAAHLQTGDLGAYDTVVVGIRAYGYRSDLRAARERLLAYVAAGGNLLVQYQKPMEGWDRGQFPPYRLQLGTPSIRWRVTDPAAPVRLLQPSHPLLTWPNRLEPADWQGWVRERGLYFASEWAPEYTPLLEVADPGEEPLRGGLLTARYGRGHYTFTALTLHYQLERQVPGAYRLLANLVSLGRAPAVGTAEAPSH